MEYLYICRLSLNPKFLTAYSAMDSELRDTVAPLWRTSDGLSLRQAESGPVFPGYLTWGSHLAGPVNRASLTAER